jgi:hypothetical protein
LELSNVAVIFQAVILITPRSKCFLYAWCGIYKLAKIYFHQGVKVGKISGTIAENIEIGRRAIFVFK